MGRYAPSDLTDMSSVKLDTYLSLALGFLGIRLSLENLLSSASSWIWTIPFERLASDSFRLASLGCSLERILQDSSSFGQSGDMLPWS